MVGDGYKDRTIYSSVRRRAAGFVTFTPSTLALSIPCNVGSKKMKENVAYEPFQNRDAIPTAHTVSNLGSKAFVMHEKKIDLPHIINQELLETIGEEVTSLSVTPTAVNND
jgi:hypothetical protein